MANIQLTTHKPMNEHDFTEVMSKWTTLESPSATEETLLETWRRQISLALVSALEIVCRQYNGIKKDEIQALLKCGDVLQAYFLLTQTSQELANDTKAMLFLKIRSIVGVIGKVKDTRSCEDMIGMDVTRRTPSWRKCLKTLVPWWTKSQDLERILAFRRIDYHEGNANQMSQYSRVACEIGSYIHTFYGESIAMQCAKMFSWQLVCIVPGRMIHTGLPWIGVTPDAIGVVDERAFHYVYQKMMRGETLRQIERGAGAPWLTLEIKTIHGSANKDTEESAMIHEGEIEQLYSVYENDHDLDKKVTKKAAIELLVKKLEIAKWIPKNLYSENVDFALEKNTEKLTKTVDSKKRKTCAFFKKSTILYPTEQFRKLCVESVGAELYPNLAKLPLRAADEPPKKKGKWHDVVDLKNAVLPGKACVIVYRIGETAVNEVLFRLDWDEAPFMLTLNSDHFNQIMGQHATARQLNDDVKSLFAVTFRSHRRPTARYGKDPIQLAVVYAYDVGIQSGAIDGFSDVISREIALAAQGDEDSESLHAMLLKDTSLTERKQILYRRASGLEKLAEPNEIAINAYREAFNDCWYDDEYTLEKWTSDDVDLS